MDTFRIKNLKGVFFDLYGTLLIFNDIEQSWKDWFGSFYDLIKNKSEITYEEFSKRCDSFMKREVIKDESAGLTTYETRIRDLCSSININLNAVELKNIAEITPRAWQKYISPAGDAFDVLDKLKLKFKLALITNFDHSPHIKTTLKENDLGRYFDAVIISDEAGLKKPDPEIFKLALRETGLHSDEVIFVGDSGDDINGAKAADIRPVLIMHDSFTNMHDYEHEVNNRKTFQFGDDVILVRSLSGLLELIG